MIALTPQLVALTTGVGAVMILVGLRRGLLQHREASRRCPSLQLPGIAGAYQPNLAELTRCGRLRRRTPFAGLQRSWQNLTCGARRQLRRRPGDDPDL